ncbi:DUF4145 domain-containing protein [Sphingobium indicum]|uniref:DUF4145 domain-containing protein n=1 Tax=Sphingobium TaxID=165695 RepID=UPI0009FC3F2F|nr:MULTISPECIES: DUF4145 domain-containing protein [Sphingobium]
MNDLHTLGGVDRCPHCSVSPPLLLQMWRGGTPSTDGARRQWGFFACVKCGGGIAASSLPNFALEDQRPASVFPAVRSAHEDIPPIARQFLQQAFDTLHAPDAAGVMAGSAVDSMLKELGYEKGSVYERIDQALGDNKLTEGMAAWAHSVRLGANRPRHADKEKPHLSPDEAKQSVDFAEALGNFLFVLSAKIQRGIAAAKAAES